MGPSPAGEGEAARRILFRTLPAMGHFHPLVPPARAASAAGHAIAFATPAAFRPVVEGVGFRCSPAGFDHGGVPLDDRFPAMRGLAGEAFTRFVNGHIPIADQEAQGPTVPILRLPAELARLLGDPGGVRRRGAARE